MEGELHVFNAQQRWVLTTTKTYKVRKTHRKSRAGCKSCKVRRVKCDEQRPRCSQCDRRGMICAYQGDAGPPLPLWPGRKTPPVLANDTSGFTTDHDLQMLHHFVEVVGPDMYSKRSFNAQSIDIWSLARSVPHVMHAVLAAAALHLNATTSNRAHSYIETGHWLDASSAFREALVKPNFTSNPDPILTTCMLLNLLSFANVDAAAPPRSRWPLAEDTPGVDALQWLRVQLGLSPLLTSLSFATKGQSIWMPLFIASDYRYLHDERNGIVDIPVCYHALFELTESSDIKEHTYLRLVRRIVMLRAICTATEREIHASGSSPSTPTNHDHNALRYMQFMQAVQPKHIDLLSSRDPRTMLLYLHFMAMLCGVTHWWCWPRAKAETGAVVRYLDREWGESLGCMGGVSVEEQGGGKGMGGALGERGDGEQGQVVVEGWLDFPGRQVGYTPRYGRIDERVEETEGAGGERMSGGEK